MSGPKGIAELNVYKKVAIIRTSTDAVTYEDADGVARTITDLGEAASTAVSACLLAGTLGTGFKWAMGCFAVVTIIAQLLIFPLSD